MKGQMEKFWVNPLSDGRKYATLIVNQEKYTTWDKALIAGLENGEYKPGAQMEYEWQQSGKYKNIKKVMSVKNPSGNDKHNGQDGLPQNDINPLTKKDREIVRMSSIKASLYITKDRLDMDIDEKAETAIRLAKKFEKYISNDDFSFPEDGEPNIAE